MRTLAAVLVCILLFLFSWVFIAFLVAILGWGVMNTGIKSGLFLLTYWVLIVIVAPGVAAGLGVFASSSKFTDIPSSIILVSFVSICAVLLSLLALFGVATLVQGSLNVPEFLVFVAQAAAILVGAKIGSAASPVREHA